MKTTIPKGTRDFSVIEMARRNYIFNTIKDVYTLYGYQQIETPAMENLSTLMGKYGEEGDKLLFRIQNSGEKAQLPPEKGLRYDLTVPFARYVVMHRDELQFPFKRFQIQPVWRADRPQKGRYREFYQCDADVVGSDSLLNEVELIQIMQTVFNRLGIRVTIKLNNRKILSGIAEYIGAPDKIVNITVALDKLDKIGATNVKAELEKNGISTEAISKLQPLFDSNTLTTEERLSVISEMLKDSEVGMKGIEETRFILSSLSPQTPQTPSVSLDLTLARGLNYYTGAIFEVKALDVEIGSITGGGRYDNLTGIFGLPGISGVGISFGADRIYDVLDQLHLFPDDTTTSTRLLFVHFGEAERKFCLPLLNEVRTHGIAAEVYPDCVKMKKQMTYANAKNIPYVAIVGETEMQTGKVMLKHMSTGEQKLVSIDELIITIS